MITLTCGFKVSFRDKIDKFCFHNEISIYNRTCLGNIDRYTCSGEINSIDNLLEYNRKLELERKHKSLWYKLLN